VVVANFARSQRFVKMTILKNINHINIIVKYFAQSQGFFEHFLELQPHSGDERAYLVGEGGPILVALEFPPMPTFGIFAKRASQLSS
jgi:hypothetical protein